MDEPGRAVLDPATAVVVSGVRYWPLGFARRFGQTTSRPKTLDATVEQRLIEEQGPGWVAQSRDQLPAIVGQQEVVALFRLPARGNLATAIATGRFPAADWVLSGSPLWLLETVIEGVPVLRESARSLPWQPFRTRSRASWSSQPDSPSASLG